MKKTGFRKRLRTKVAILVVLAFTCTAYANAGSKMIGKVANCDYLNFRTGSGTDKKVVKILKRGESLDILSKENGWYKVSVNGKTGWVCSTYVSVSSTKSTASASPSSSGKVGYVSATALNCRSGSSVACRILEVLDQGEKVSILDSSSGWYKVKVKSGKIGWVCAMYISSKSVSVSNKTVTVSSSGSVKTTTSGSSSSRVAEIVSRAKYVKSLGIPYVWGGTTLSGFDCSGFVQYVYKKSGISLPRVASAQASIGSYVSKGNIKAGDLVFFGSGSSITHVGLYIGSNSMIHAPTSGQNVSQVSISSSYYKANYVTARRVVN